MGGGCSHRQVGLYTITRGTSDEQGNDDRRSITRTALIGTWRYRLRRRGSRKRAGVKHMRTSDFEKIRR